MSLPTGTRLGPYEIVAAIGAGGMGEVYQARDSKLNRDVALKVLPASVAADVDRLARFRREAQVLASLNHPHIAQIYGVEDSGGVQALVMELVPGRTLAEMIDGPRHSPPAAVAPGESASRGATVSGGGAPRAIEIEDAIRIARQIAEALEAAHEQGVVHRDLKPANVKVRDDGTVKVLDFGLAKALDPTSGAGSQAEVMNSPTLTARATQLGVILGTAAYMSPEQAKGRPVDRRADIWAFGVVLYEMLAGRRGYEAEDISETLAAVLTREVDWAALPANTPPRLRALVRDCLVRDPKQRLRDVGEARRVLDQLSGEASGATSANAAPASGAVSPPARRWTRAVPWAVAVVAMLAAAGMGWRLMRAPAPPAGAVTRARAPLKELSGFVQLSHDGTRLAYTVTGGQQGFFIAVRQMDQFEATALNGADGGLFPVFSPDGQWIVFSTQVSPPKIKKVPIAGGTAITLCDGYFADGADWGEDDTIVFSGAKGLMRVPATGGTPQALTTVDASKGETRHVRPQFLPGGRQLLFTVLSNAGSQFAVLDLKKGGYRAVARGGDNGRYAPTGHLTFVRDSTLFALPFDLASLTVTGSEAPVIEGVSTTGPVGTGDYTFSNAGALVYAESLSNSGTVLTWVDRKGTVQAIPGQVPRKWGTGRLSPDGLRVANGIVGEKGTDIWVVDLARGTPTRLTFDGAGDTPIWTPDGLRVVYGSAKDGKWGVYAVLADGSGQPELLTTTDSPVLPTSFSPDGKTLLYTQAVNGRGRIMVLPPAAAGATREPHPLRESSGADSDATISPDGKWVAFTSSESGSAEIYLLPFPGPGPKLRVSTQGGRNPRWAHSGRELFFWAANPGAAPLMSVSVPSGPAPSIGVPRDLFKYFSGTTWDVAPDGERFLMESVGIQGSGAVFVTVTDWFDELRRRAPAKK